MPGLTVLDDGINQDARFLKALFASQPYSPVNPDNTGKVLSVDSNGNIVLSVGSGGSSSLAGLSDVDLAGLQPGQGLLWNGSKWVPGSAGSAGAGLPINSYAAVPGSGQVLVTHDSTVWLRTGVVASAAEYPLAESKSLVVGSPLASFADVPYCQVPLYKRVA